MRGWAMNDLQGKGRILGFFCRSFLLTNTQHTQVFFILILFALVMFFLPKNAKAEDLALDSPFNLETISAGFDHTCGLKMDGTIVCWGDNTVGQTASPEGTFTQLSAGEYHNCGVKTDGTIACWGDNGEGQATSPAGAYTQVSAGGYHSCGLQPDGTITCWGDNYYGQANSPAGTFTQVSAGLSHNYSHR